MAKIIEVITLMSSDEETPIQVDMGREIVEITVKDETVEDKKIITSSTSNNRKLSLNSNVPSSYPVATSSNSNTSSPIVSKSNNVGLKQTTLNYKYPRTARKSFSSLRNAERKDLNCVSSNPLTYKQNCHSNIATSKSSTQASRTKRNFDSQQKSSYSNVATENRKTAVTGINNNLNEQLKVNNLSSKKLKSNHLLEQNKSSNPETISSLASRFKNHGVVVTNVNSPHTSMLLSKNEASAPIKQNGNQIDNIVKNIPNENRINVESLKKNSLMELFPNINKDLSVVIKEANNDKIYSEISTSEIKRKQLPNGIHESLAFNSNKKRKLSSSQLRIESNVASNELKVSVKENPATNPVQGKPKANLKESPSNTHGKVTFFDKREAGASVKEIPPSDKVLKKAFKGNPSSDKVLKNATSTGLNNSKKENPPSKKVYENVVSFDRTELRASKKENLPNKTSGKTISSNRNKLSSSAVPSDLGVITVTNTGIAYLNKTGTPISKEIKDSKLGLKDQETKADVIAVTSKGIAFLFGSELSSQEIKNTKLDSQSLLKKLQTKKPAEINIAANMLQDSNATTVVPESSKLAEHCFNSNVPPDPNVRTTSEPAKHCTSSNILPDSYVIRTMPGFLKIGENNIRSNINTNIVSKPLSKKIKDAELDSLSIPFKKLPAKKPIEIGISPNTSHDSNATTIISESSKLAGHCFNSNVPLDPSLRTLSELSKPVKHSTSSHIRPDSNLIRSMPGFLKIDENSIQSNIRPPESNINKTISKLLKPAEFLESNENYVSSNVPLDANGTSVSEFLKIDETSIRSNIPFNSNEIIAENNISSSVPPPVLNATTTSEFLRPTKNSIGCNVAGVPTSTLDLAGTFHEVIDTTLHPSSTKLISSFNNLLVDKSSEPDIVSSFSADSNVQTIVNGDPSDTISKRISDLPECPLTDNLPSTEFVMDDWSNKSEDRLLHEKEMLVSQKFENVSTENFSSNSSSRIQPKQVTSPKLSLKRKREEDSTKSFGDSKKSLFLHSTEENNSCTVVKGDFPWENRENSTPFNPVSIDPQPSLGDRCQNRSINLSTKEDNSLPGPSHCFTSVENNKQKFGMLLEFCIPNLKFTQQEEAQMRKVFRNKINRASESYIKSLEFSNLLDSTWEKIKNNPERTTIHLNDLKMKIPSFKKKSSGTRSSDCASPVVHSSNAQSTKYSTQSLSDNNKNNLRTEPSNVTDVFGEGRERNVDYETKLKLNSISRTSLQNLISEKAEKEKLDKSIQKLERYLEQLDKRIKKLQAKELSLDDLDDEDSTYIQEDRYKRKFNKMWKLLCKYKNCSRSLGRQIERRFRYKGTRFQEINEEVERLINKRTASEKVPNYGDIFDLIKRVNETIEIGMRDSDYQSLAKEVFENVCKELKRRRQKDTDQDFGCYLTDNVKLEDDPAEKDETLQRKLASSIAQGEQKLNEIFEKYAAKQETEGNREDASEEEESDTRLEPEYNEVDPDLPDTEPATPVTEHDESESESANLNRKAGTKVIDIASDSDASTDPGPDVSRPPQSDYIAAVDSPVLRTVPPTVENDSSSDLPSL